MEKIRTRFAPSPTGKMHIGNLRTALYAYLIAKHEKGDFLLRIEDTDQERLVEGALETIYQTLQSAHLVHDEGPDKGGQVGPYIQSERQKEGVYLHYAKELVEKKEAYYCFCSQERLDSLKTKIGDKEVFLYDKHCLSLSEQEIQTLLSKKVPYVIRQNNPTEGETVFHDEIYGEISVENKELDDMVLIKSDGYPTYNFANVVDDHLMGISHVVRGNEYLSSSPKYNRLYEAFGWKVPVYIHCPLITNEEHKKLSKRSGHSSYEDLLEQGFLPETIINFVALLGWSPASNQEIFSLEELIQQFDYRQMSKSPAVFDVQKLKWMNGEYIKNMNKERYYFYALPYVKEAVHRPLNLHAIADLVQTRVEIFPDIIEKIDFFDELPVYDVSLYTHKKMKTTTELSLLILKEVYPLLERLDNYDVESLSACISEYVQEKAYKNGQVLWPLRTAVSGKAMTPAGAYEMMEILGKEESLQRIRKGIELLTAI
ncbi:glutamate--tRNA ligase [Clostridia bacterium]|nr:glutamate--tRNA ligase [Clostridia bacterium]